MARRTSLWVKILVPILFIGVVTVAVTAYLLYGRIYQPNVKLDEKKSTIIYIPTSSDFEDVKNILAEENILVDTSSFLWLAEKKNYTKKVKPGRYRIADGMSNNTLVNMLRAGLQEPVNLTLHNIRTKNELASRVTSKLEIDSVELVNYLDNNDSLKRFGLNKDNILTLFIPNTYQFYWNSTPSTFMSRMAKEYKTFWTAERKEKANQLGMSQTEISVLASIVQSETNAQSDKPIIAGVYINRLKKRMPLEADPTLVWALGDFSIKRVLNVHKQIESPYNTYKYPGLPPGPITLPSVSSLDAVLNYEKHNYIYFCAKEDFSGYSNFACTYEDHLKNAKKYQRELTKRRIMK